MSTYVCVSYVFYFNVSLVFCISNSLQLVCNLLLLVYNAWLPECNS